MKLIDFQPGFYRNLPSQPIHFTRTPEVSPKNGCSIRFLVGKNGIGKTNILRFLASIFLAIEEDYRRPRPNSPAYTIPYRLTYELHGTNIEVSSKGKGRSGVTFKIGDQEPQAAGDIPSRDLILPANVLVYTSGDYQDWQKLFQPGFLEEESEENDTSWTFRRLEDEQSPQRIRPPDFVEASKTESQTVDVTLEAHGSVKDQANSSPPYQRVNLVSDVHLKLALLSALLDHQFHQREISALSDALAEVKIRLLAFSFQIHLDDTVPIYRDHLNALYDLATRRIQQWDDQLWVYDLTEIDIQTGQSTLQKIDEQFLESPFNFFQMLCNLQGNKILQNANLIIEYTPDQGSGQSTRVLLSDDLSDGEFAFLSRMGLIYLLNEKECLFLLDEPEVHFNDDWKRNLVDSIERALTVPDRTESEVILTSHASIVLTDAYPDEVVFMTPAGQEDNIPLTLASDQGEPLRYFFDSEHSVGRRAMRIVEEIIKSGTIQDLEALLDQVGPGYYRFKIIKELESRVSSTGKDNLSPAK
jgi:predicted ATPase